MLYTEYYRYTSNGWGCIKQTVLGVFRCLLEDYLWLKCMQLLEHVFTKISMPSTYLLSHLWIQHDFRGSVPPCCHVLRQEAGVIMVRICNSGQPEIANLEIARRVEEQIWRLQIAVKHVGGVDVLQTAKNLIQKVANVIVAESLKRNAFVGMEVCRIGTLFFDDSKRT